MATHSLDHVLESALQLPEEQQIMLIEILRNRRATQRRDEIAADAAVSLQAFEEGKLNSSSAESLITELRQLLSEDTA